MAKTWADDGDESFRNRRMCTDIVASELNSSRHLTPLQRGALASTVAGAVWTRDRAFRAGYDVANVCPLCGEGGDTVHHRTWHCPHTSEARKDVPRWLILEAQAAGHADAFWATGVFPHPADKHPHPAHDLDATCTDGSGHYVGEVGNWGLTGDIYVDGSCTRCDVKEMQRAGAAVVATNAVGDVVKIIRAVVPDTLPQTPQAAEFVGFAIAHRFMEGPCRIHSDCKNVVDAAAAGISRQLDPRRTYAGILRDTLKNRHKQHYLEGILKVKAHQRIEAMDEGDAKRHAKGNQLADDHAKQAVDMHPQPDDQQRRDGEYWSARAHIVARTVAKAMATFPPMGQRLTKIRAGAIRQRPRRRPTGGSAGASPNGEAATADRHEWAFRAGKWRCEQCARIHNGSELTEDLRWQRCKGPRPNMNPEEMEAKGHRMSLAEASIPFAICLKCGAWMARRVFARLRKACEAPTVNGKQALDRLRRGLPPWAARGRTASLGNSAVVVGRWTKEHGWIAAAPQIPTPSDQDRGGAATASAEALGSDGPGGEPQRARDEGTAARMRLEAVRGRVRDREAAKRAQEAGAWRLTHHRGGQERERPGGQPGAEDVPAAAEPREDDGEREAAATKRAASAADCEADDRGVARRRVEGSAAQDDRHRTTLEATLCSQREGGDGAGLPNEGRAAKWRRMSNGGTAEDATAATGCEERPITEMEPQHEEEQAVFQQPHDDPRPTDRPASLEVPRPQRESGGGPGDRDARSSLGVERPIRRRRLSRSGKYADAGSATSDAADRGGGGLRLQKEDRREASSSRHGNEESNQRGEGDMPQGVPKRRRLRWKQPPARAPEDAATSATEMVSGP